MTEHVGGPESAEKIAKRQARYEVQGSGQFAIIDDASGDAVGWVGYWEREWRDAEVYEVGWSVLPAFQGRGVAGRATAQLLDVIRSEGSRRFVHAYPSVDNAPSNGICRKLGFVLLDVCDFEYPPGNSMRCNDWRFDLEATD
jgi:RimJ/RimL family protein N-acetyltransferase